MKTGFSMAWRLLRRDWRAGELSILVLALIIAVVSTTAIVLVANRLTRTMTQQAADFLAADMVVTSHSPLPKVWLERARSMGLATGEKIEFTSVVVEQDQLLLVGVKAVSENYPLRGFLKTTTTDLAQETVTRQPPPPGHVWVESRVLAQLGLRLGDTLQVGKVSLAIDRIITYEPDTRTNFYSLAPRVLMRIEDLPAAGILAPGSRAHYNFLFAGGQRQLEPFKRWLKPKLQSNQRLLDIRVDRPDVGRAVSRAERYLGLTSIMVVLIAGVAVAMAARRYSERHFDATAVMKCMGARQGEILRLYVLQFLVLGIIACAMGTFIGWAVQETLLYFLRNLLPEHLAQPDWFAYSFGPVTGLLMLLGFALPPLLRLKRVPPLLVLRRELSPPPISAWLVYGLAVMVVTLLLWRFTKDYELSFLILGGGIGGLLVLAALVYGLLLVSQVAIKRTSLAWRLGLRNLSRHRQATIGQVLAFCVTLAAMAVSLLVRTDLVETWQSQLPDNAPNHFVLNIFPRELESFKNFLINDLGAQSSEFFPIVRGRLIEVNGMDVHRLARKDSEGEMAINRDLSLTWARRLPSDNRLVSGSWWQDKIQERQVSVELDLAKSLGIHVGDRLSFLVEGRRIDARATSLRTVQWDSMTPNFYMIFAPGSLEGFAATYMTSFYLPVTEKARLSQLIKRFPNVTLVEVEMILKRFRMILRQVNFAVEYVLSFALLAGITVLMAAVRSSIDERIYQGALLKALGARKRLLQVSLWVEFLGLGALAGTLAVCLTEIVIWVVYARVFRMAYQLHPFLWLILPVTGALLTGIAGYWSTRKVFRQSPVRVFREI